MTDKDPWQPESGNLTNYEGTVIDAHFGSDPQYNPNTRFLQLKMATDAPEKPEHEERYNLPPGWETWDGGKTVEHESKVVGKTFNMNSQVGQLVTKLLQNAPEAVDVLRSRGKMNEASPWIGLRFFMEETAKPYSFKNDKGEQVEGVSTKNHPTKFLGVSDDVAAPQTLPGAVAPPVAAPELISAADRVVLKAMAKTQEHGEWVENVMGYDAGRLLSNPELVSMLADESGLYLTLKNEA